MPTLAGPFAHLARRISRSRGSVELAVVMDGVQHSLDADGVPLRGFYGEAPIETTDDAGHVMVSSAPVITLCLADLPRAPRRGDVIVFDDGPMTIAAPPQPTGGGSVTCVLTQG